MLRFRSNILARIGNTTAGRRQDRPASYPARSDSFSGGVSSSTMTRRSMSLCGPARVAARFHPCGLKYEITGSSNSGGTNRRVMG
jgi:hypothetical protein